MRAEKSQPVLFLAFAQDRVAGGAYLRNLPEELRQIRAALESAKSAGLCEVVERANATIADILDVFQQREYRNRIALFHYGGHANGYQLLLESAAGQTQVAHAGGLAAFLAQQNGLQLVFLNGCSTEPQVEGLLQARVPAVIATAQAIDDAVAASFATRFYQGLGSGASLRQAYEEAAAAVGTQKGDNYRHVYTGSAPPEERWPWALYPQESGEAHAWSLSKAIENPLFGLPAIPLGDLPPKPYRHLNWFARKHAEIFFGRERQIRRLYDLVSTPDSAPILLLYGQSGVGKSSILEAGLLPRLETTHKTRYCRRQQEIGLSTTLGHALAVTDMKMHFIQAWHRLEQECKKPVVVILDQLEEAYTRANKNLPDELKEFWMTLQTMFADQTQRPQGKLILSFRKEWLAEIEKRLDEQELFHAKVFLERLDREGIIAAITGPARSPRLRKQYGLTIRDSLLAEIIADDLDADRDSPIAPLLQILLTKMWEEAVARNYSQPSFDRNLYDGIRKTFKALDDFLKRQIEALCEWNAEVVNSGLTLDVLAYHTTPLGTAEQHTAEQLTQEYHHLQEVMPDLIHHFKHELFLLVDSAEDQPEVAQATTTRLAHDTLAPVVRKQFEDSDKPGQRARRILENRSVEWHQGQQGAPLDERDLTLVEQGETGMRAWKPDEQRLIEASRKQREQNQRRRRARQRVVALALLLILISAALAWWQRNQAKWNGQLALARQLVAQAELTRNQQPSFLQRSVLLAVESMQRFNALGERSLEADQALRRGLALLPRPLEHFTLARGINDFALSPDEKYLAVAGRDSSVVIWEISSDQLAAHRKYQGEVLAVAFSRTGKYLAATNGDYSIRLLEGKNWHETARMELPAPVTRIVFSPKGNWLAAATWDSTVTLWEVPGGNLKTRILHYGNITGVEFNAEEKYLVTADDGGSAQIWDIAAQHPIARLVNEGSVEAFAVASEKNWFAATNGLSDVSVWAISTGHEIIRLQQEAAVTSVAFDAPGEQVAIAQENGSAHIVETNGWKLVASVQHPRKIFTAAFSPDGKYLVTCSEDQTARVWEAATGNEIVLISNEQDLLGAVFMHNAKNLITADRNGAVWFWEISNAREVMRVKHDGQVRSIAFSSDGEYLATASWDRTARVWKRTTAEEVARFKHGSLVQSAALSPDGKNVASAGFDATVRLWHAFSGEEIASLSHSFIFSIEFDRSGEYLALASDDSSAEVWAIRQQSRVAHLKHRGAVYAAAFSPDGKYLATASEDSTSRIWEVRSGKELLCLYHSDKVRDVAYSFDGKLLASAGDDKSVRVWDTKTAREIANLPHEQKLWAVAFSPDGKYLATASQDRTARVWEIASRQEVARISHDGEVFAVAFSPDGAYIATASEDQTARLWLWRPEDLIKDACSRLTRNLTREEWQQYLGDEPYRKTCPDTLVYQH